MAVLSQNMITGFSRIENTVSKLNNSINELQKDFAEYGQRLTTIENNVTSVDNNMISVIERVDTLELKAQEFEAGLNLDNDIDESLFGEFEDRIRRRSNICIFGFKESLKENSYDQELDKQCISKLINSFLMPDHNIDTNNIKIVRLGKFSQGRDSPRPVKVLCGTPAAASAILDSARKTREVDPQKLVSISVAPDKTVKQQEYYKKIKKILDDRTKAGESNLRIRYSKGIPFITTI